MSHFNPAEALIWYVVFVYSTVCHEAGHAWSAFKLGDATAYEGGQVSLDPTPHIRREPFGMVIVPILSFVFGGGMFGWASAPFDPTWAQRYPRRAVWMALAGPAANLALVLLAALSIRIGISTGFLAAPDFINRTSMVAGITGSGSQFLALLLSIVFSLNLLLFSFNLLPLPPLDGSTLPFFFLRPRAAQKYREFLSNPTVRLMGLLIAMQGFGPIFSLIHRVALVLLYPDLRYS